MQALLAKEEKPKEQNKNGLHVAQDLEGYSGKPADADELAQIDTMRVWGKTAECGNQYSKEGTDLFV